MPHDVFISYASPDKVVADAICSRFEGARIRCWIAPRDVLPGAEFGLSIIRAIEDCRVVVLVFSGQSNRSRYVRKEVERAVGKGKIIVPFRIEDVAPSGAMDFFLGDTHWLDAMTPPLEMRIGELVTSAKRLLNDHDYDILPAFVTKSASAPLRPKDARSRVFFNNDWDGFDPSTDADTLFYLDLRASLDFVYHISLHRRMKDGCYSIGRGISALPELTIEPFDPLEPGSLSLCLGSSEIKRQSPKEYDFYFDHYHPLVPDGVVIDLCDGNEEAMWNWTIKVPPAWLTETRPYLSPRHVATLQDMIDKWIETHNREIARIDRLRVAP